MQVASVKDRRPISFGIQDLGLVNSSDAPPCFSALCASSGGCATPLMEHCMEQNTNSNIANDALLEILLEHPDFSDFERKGVDDYRPPESEFKNSGFSISLKGWTLHADKGEQSKYNLNGINGSLFDLAKDRGLLDQAREKSGVIGQFSAKKSTQKRTTNDIANDLWNKAIRGDEARNFVEGYLTEKRRIPVTNYIDLVNSGLLRFLPAKGPYPSALVHPFHFIDPDGSIRETIHKIHLTHPDGSPRKKHLGSDGHLSVFQRLDSTNPDNSILVTEGLEDALTIRNRYPRKLIVVTGSKANLKHLNRLAKQGQGILIIADHDDNDNVHQNGQYEADRVRKQLSDQGVNCVAMMPKQSKWDANAAQQQGKLELWWQSLEEVHKLNNDGPVIKPAKAMAPPVQRPSNSGIENGLQLTPEGSDWDTPDDLFTTTKSEPYPIEMLPDNIRYAVEEVADFVQAPVPLVAASALSTISTVVQGHYDVRRADGLQGPTSLYMLSIADSGERKSSSNKFSKVLWDHEQQEQERMEPKLKEYRAKKEAWETKKAGVRQQLKDLRRKNKPIAETEEELIQLGYEEPELPKTPRWLYQDTTGEALLHELTKWPVGTLESDEAGSVFGGYSMRESPMKLMGDLNRLWDALPLHVDRRHSDSLVVQGVRLSVALMIQEPSLRSFFEKSNGLVRGTGFLARFLVSWPSSRIGSRHFKDQPFGSPNLRAFQHRMERLLREELPINSKGQLEPQVLEFSPQAFKCWVKFYNEVEQELAPGRDMHDVRDVASKTAENAARIAANFHVFAGENSNQISADHLDAAKSIALWHLYEAQRFFGEIEMPRENTDALKLFQWLHSKCLKEQTTFKLRRQLQGGGPVRDSKLLNQALNVLHEHSYCRTIKVGKQIRVEVNPSLLGIQDGSS